MNDTAQIEKWFAGYKDASGRGGVKNLADELDTSEATISKLASGKTHLHDLTLKVAALIQLRHDKNYEQYELVGTQIKGNWVYKTRVVDGNETLTWEIKQ